MRLSAPIFPHLPRPPPAVGGAPAAGVTLRPCGASHGYIFFRGEISEQENFFHFTERRFRFFLI